MDRRSFLKFSGLMAAGRVVQSMLPPGERDWALLPGVPAATLDVAARPAGTSLSIDQPAIYRISGLVRLDAPFVEISGMSHSQRITWSDSEATEQPVASFVAFERIDGPGLQPAIRVQGGQLLALAAVPLD